MPAAGPGTTSLSVLTLSPRPLLRVWPARSTQDQPACLLSLTASSALEVRLSPLSLPHLAAAPAHLALAPADSLTELSWDEQGLGASLAHLYQRKL